MLSAKIRQAVKRNIGIVNVTITDVSRNKDNKLIRMLEGIDHKTGERYHGSWICGHSILSVTWIRVS